MSRFDQKDLATNPYGKCKDCGVSLETEDLARTHMTDSRHCVWILNPSRQRNIERHVDSEIEMALDDVFQDLYRLVEREEATADEIEKALSNACYLDDEWRKFVDGSQ